METENMEMNEVVRVSEEAVETRTTEHMHSYFDFVIPCSGQGFHLIDGRKYEIEPGFIYFIDRDVPHAFFPKDEIRYDEILISPLLFDEKVRAEILRTAFYKEDEYLPAIKLKKDEIEVLNVIKAQIKKEITEKKGDYRSILRHWVILMSAGLERAAERACVENDDRDPEHTIDMVLEYIDNHYSDTISQTELSERFGYQYAYFSRMFKLRRGIALSEYLTEKRIEKGAELLLNTDWSSERITREVGYKSAPQFYRTFLRLKGLTPRQYRIAHGK